MKNAILITNKFYKQMYQKMVKKEKKRNKSNLWSSYAKCICKRFVSVTFLSIYKYIG